MLPSIWIAILVIAVVFQVIAIYEKSIIFSVFTIMFWLVLMLECLTIQWPYYEMVYNASANMTVISEGHIYFSHPGLSMLFMGFVFINVIWAAIQFFDFQERSRLP